MQACIDEDLYSAIINVADNTCLQALNNAINIIKNDKRFYYRAIKMNHTAALMCKAAHELNYLMPDDVRCDEQV